MLAVVQRQRVPDDWVVSVFDAGRRASRARADTRPRSAPARAPSLRELIAPTADEGMGVTRRSRATASTPRTCGCATPAGSSPPACPTAAFEADLLKAVVVYGGGDRAVAAAGGAVRAAVRRRINRPIAELREAARALGRGTVPRGAAHRHRRGARRGRTLEQAARELARSEGRTRDAARGRAPRAHAARIAGARQLAAVFAGGRRSARRPKRPTAPRTSSSRCSATSCATRSRRSSPRCELMKRRHAGVAERERGIIERQVSAPVAAGRRPARRLAHRAGQGPARPAPHRSARTSSSRRSSSPRRRSASARRSTWRLPTRRCGSTATRCGWCRWCATCSRNAVKFTPPRAAPSACA